MNRKALDDFINSNNLRIWDGSVKGLHLRRNAKSFTWYISYRNLERKEQSYKVGSYPTLTLETARKSAKLLLANLAMGKDPRDEKQKIKKEAQNTIQSYFEQTYSKILLGKKSGKETAQYFQRHCQDLMALTFSQLDARAIHSWHMGMIDKGLADSSIVRVYGAFKTMVNDAVKRGQIPDSPIRSIPLEKIHREQQGVKQVNQRSYLTREQITQLFVGIDAYQEEKRKQRANSRAHGRVNLPVLDGVYVDHVKPMILIAFYTGLRPSDIRSLRWEHISFSSWGNSISKVLTKTAHKNNEPHSLPLTDDVVKVLKAWKQQQNTDGGLVFPNPKTGNELSKSALKRPWKYIKELAGLPEALDFYNLRHNFISWLVMSGVDMFTVAKLSGHANSKMIEQHYGHLSPKHKEDALSKAFDSMMGSQIKAKEEGMVEC